MGVMKVAEHDITEAFRERIIAALQRLMADHGLGPDDPFPAMALYREALVYIHVACGLYAIAETENLEARDEWQREAACIVNKQLVDFTQAKRDEKLESN